MKDLKLGIASDHAGFPTGSYLSDQVTTLNGSTSSLETAISDTVLYLYDKENFQKVNSALSVKYMCPECGAASSQSNKKGSCSSCKATWDFPTGNHVWSYKWNGGKTTEFSLEFNEDNLATKEQILALLNNALLRLTDKKVEGFFLFSLDFYL